MYALTLLAPSRGRSVERRNDDGRSEPGPGRSVRLPGFVPGGWKRNVVVGLSYLLGALVLFGLFRFLLEIL